MAEEKGQRVTWNSFSATTSYAKGTPPVRKNVKDMTLEEYKEHRRDLRRRSRAKETNAKKWEIKYVHQDILRINLSYTLSLRY